jgi:flagellar hook-associated protein 1 FlgK
MSVINIGLSGLLAAQRGLEVTANNVANASTDGYIRRRLVQAEATGSGAGLLAGVGNGVDVLGIERVYDQFVTDQLRGQVSSEQRAQSFSDLATRLDNLIGNPDVGLSTSVQAFYSQVELLARDPTSASNREQLLQQANSLTQRFHQIDSQIASLDNEVNKRLQDSVTRINGIAASLAAVNAELARGGTASNDLADKRDLLIRQLTEQIDARVVSQSDGSISVFVGNGQPLVLGALSAKLQTATDEFNPAQLQVAFTDAATTQVISRQISGGVIGGLLAFRSESLEPARRDLGLVAQGLTTSFNAQHKLGVDANGNLGADFFANIPPTTLVGKANSGTAAVSASIGTQANLVARDYQLRYDGAAWQLTDATTGVAIPKTGSGTALDPFVAEGLSVVVAGTPATGDRFRIQATTGAAGAFGVAISDAQQIAAAAPVASSAALANLSRATVSKASVTDISDASLLQSVQITFDDATHYRFRSSSGVDLTGLSLPYTSGANIDFHGWRVQISGAPEAGDQFQVQATGPGSGDNSNALALATSGSKGLFGGGTLSVDDVAGRMLANVGSTALRATQDAKIQTALRSQIEQNAENTSGVNLDEEAANMLRYQQAYQAASKIIVVANDLFQTILNMAR